MSTVTIELPERWEIMKDDEIVRCVQLTIGCKEFMEIEQNAKKTAQGSIWEIRVCS
jgi:hypothetical protein